MCPCFLYYKYSCFVWNSIYVSIRLRIIVGRKNFICTGHKFDIWDPGSTRAVLKENILPLF